MRRVTEPQDQESVREVRRLAWWCGVRIFNEPAPEPDGTSYMEQAPLDILSAAAPGAVWWCPDNNVEEVPEFARLLHEVGHAALPGYRGGLGYEGDVNAFELGFALHRWGPRSPQVRALVAWGLMGDWDLMDIRGLLRSCARGDDGSFLGSLASRVRHGRPSPPNPLGFPRDVS